MGKYFDQITNKKQLSKAVQPKSESNGEGVDFNIFNLFRDVDDESLPHTLFIAELLNPKGTHELKGVFLREFLKLAGVQIPLDCDEAFLTEERRLYGGKGIDIYIQDSCKNAILIKNDIWSRDELQSLSRYDKFASSLGWNYQILYLTPNGIMPSNMSVFEEEIEYTCISYCKTILTWLEQCLVLANDSPIVRETIRQYINYITDLFNIKQIGNSNESTAMLDSPYNFGNETDNKDKIYCEIREDFIKSLEPIAERLGLHMKYDKGFRSLENHSYIRFFNQDISESWEIAIFNIDEEINYGIRPIPEVHVCLCSINDGKIFSKLDDEICIYNDRSGMYPFGFDFLGPYYNWDNTNTIRAMLNGQLAKYIEEKVLRPILNHKLLQKIEDLTPKDDVYYLLSERVH